MSRSEQLQIRISPEQKTKLKRLARQAGLHVSEYVLSRALPQHRLRFQELAASVGDDQSRRYALAELNDLLTRLSAPELSDAIADPPGLEFPSYWRNYVAAMVEHAAQRRGVPAPAWVSRVEPLAEPHFAVPLKSLRAHLLKSSPVPFRQRNIFVDSTVGDRV